MQFSITNSSIFSHSSSSSSSQLRGFGFNEAASDNPLQIDSHLNANDSSFYMDMAMPHVQSCFIGGVHSQSPFANCNSGTLSAVTIQSMDLPSYESRNFTNKKHSQSHVERLPVQPSHELGSVVKRKRPIEKVGERAEFLGGNGTSPSEQWTTAKKMATPVQKKMQRLNHHNAQKYRVVPPRKSQKLAEKITALQKLVSPYGKTDTASVLHEASIFINVLLHQIENSVHSHPQSESNSKMVVVADRECAVRGRGFCLVPVSLIPCDSFTHFSTTDVAVPQDTMWTHSELPKQII